MHTCGQSSILRWVGSARNGLVQGLLIRYVHKKLSKKGAEKERERLARGK